MMHQYTQYFKYTRFSNKILVYLYKDNDYFTGFANDVSFVF